MRNPTPEQNVDNKKKRPLKQNTANTEKAAKTQKRRKVESDSEDKPTQTNIVHQAPKPTNTKPFGNPQPNEPKLPKTYAERTQPKPPVSFSLSANAAKYTPNVNFVVISDDEQGLLTCHTC